MDCEEYRSAIAADPGGSFEGAAGHAAGCEACRAYTAEQRALDERIGRALAIEVPELVLPELPPVAAAGPGQVADFARPRGRRFSTPAWLALAAGVAAMLVFVVRGPGPEDSYYASLAAEVLAHMDHEESSRRVTTVPVTDATLSGVLDAKVRELDTGEAIVSYAMSCVINGHVVPHLVVQGRTGPITLILMPAENVDTVVPLNGENVHGVILPADTGSIAIIGQREDQLAEIGEVGERVIDSVKWSI